MKNCTQTANFSTWFSASKVVNADGTPRVMYHGARRVFDEFDFRKGIYSNAKMRGLGNWLSESSEVASRFAIVTEAGDMPVVMPLFVRLLNPLVVETYAELLTKMGRSGGEAFRTRLQANSYDGIVITRAETEFIDARMDVVTFSAEQIKSAIGNCGKFSLESTSMTDGASDAVEKAIFEAKNKIAVEQKPRPNRPKLRLHR